MKLELAIRVEIIMWTSKCKRIKRQLIRCYSYCTMSAVMLHSTLIASIVTLFTIIEFYLLFITSSAYFYTTAWLSHYIKWSLPFVSTVCNLLYWISLLLSFYFLSIIFLSLFRFLFIFIYKCFGFNHSANEASMKEQNCECKWISINIFLYVANSRSYYQLLIQLWTE